MVSRCSSRSMVGDELAILSAPVWNPSKASAGWRPARTPIRGADGFVQAVKDRLQREFPCADLRWSARRDRVACAANLLRATMPLF